MRNDVRLRHFHRKQYLHVALTARLNHKLRLMQRVNYRGSLHPYGKQVGHCNMWREVIINDSIPYIYSYSA